MRKVIITQKDIENHKICNSESGMLIDELAYSADEWTSEQLYMENLEYQPAIPYNYDFEDDLFEATKTENKLYNIAKVLNISLNANWGRISKEQKLQAGACVALNNDTEWKNLLEAYKEKLQEDGTDGISKRYNEQLQKEIDSFEEEQRKEWLYGDYRDYPGVVKRIAKYFTDEADGVYIPCNGKNKQESFIFYLNENDIERYNEEEYKNPKDWIIDMIIARGNDRKREDNKRREERREERKRKEEYRKEREEEEKAERTKMLKSKKIK